MYCPNLYNKRKLKLKNYLIWPNILQKLFFVKSALTTTHVQYSSVSVVTKCSFNTRDKYVPEKQ